LDSFGEISVPLDSYWGAQTQRSIQNFKIGDEKIPSPLIRSLAIAKRSAAVVNLRLGLLEKRVAEGIIDAAQEIIEGKFDQHFPLVVWQTGSGTQSNMNMNEVIANIANEKLGAKIGSRDPIHPNDHVNLGQSTNDTFPSAMHIAVALLVHQALIPSFRELKKSLAIKSRKWSKLIKVGRTHLQDATPLTLGQEFSGYEAQIRAGIRNINGGMKQIYPLAQGGTAVGTGLNSQKGFDKVFAQEVARYTGLPFTSARNKFEVIAAHDALVQLSGTLNTLAVSLNKLANDVRLLGSGPRAGIGELNLPANEPGSSIMPGKVNPTQAEALSMVCAQVMGNHVTISFAGSQGHFELNAYKPVIAYNIIQSIQLLADVTKSFTNNCIEGIIPNKNRMKEHLDRSLMMITALSPKIGYDKASAIAKAAIDNDSTLKEETMKLGLLSEEEFDEIIDPAKMI